MKKELTAKMTVEELEQALPKEKYEMVLGLNKVLQVLEGKQVLIDTSNDILTNQLYKDFEYNTFQNCEKETLLDFQDKSNEENPNICVNIDDIYDITIDDNVEGVKIELKDEFTIRLELQR